MVHMIENVMLIDDEEVDQKQYTRVLMRSGIVQNVTCFSYAEDALAHLRANGDTTIDVVFLDINMPRMDGFEFLEIVSKELRQDFAHMVVVMLTTSLDPSDRERAENFDVVRDFVNKPLEIEHVRRAAEILEEIRQ